MRRVIITCAIRVRLHLDRVLIFTPHRIVLYHYTVINCARRSQYYGDVAYDITLRRCTPRVHSTPYVHTHVCTYT
jgi:hypothetical protein